MPAGLLCRDREFKKDKLVYFLKFFFKFCVILTRFHSAQDHLESCNLLQRTDSRRAFSLRVRGYSCSVSWNAVDFLNPHQSILGLWGRAYLKPPFPRELRLESVSKQLADSPSFILSPSQCVYPKAQWKRT